MAPRRIESRHLNSLAMRGKTTASTGVSIWGKCITNDLWKEERRPRIEEEEAVDRSRKKNCLFCSQIQHASKQMEPWENEHKTWDSENWGWRLEASLARRMARLYCKEENTLDTNLKEGSRNKGNWNATALVNRLLVQLRPGRCHHMYSRRSLYNL